MTKQVRDILFWVTTSAWLALVALDWFVDVPVGFWWFGCGWIACLVLIFWIEIGARVRRIGRQAP